MHGPSRPIRPPNRTRHALDAITRRTFVKDRNSVALPWVDMQADTEMIRAGNADRLPNGRYLVNGRVYFIEGNEHGTLVPESGNGIIVLNREEMRALVIFIKYGHDTDRALREMDADPSISPGAVDIATALHAQRTNRQ